MVEEPVETGADGEPILGYRVPKASLQAFCRQVKAFTGEDCFFATKEDGDHVKVIVYPCSGKPTGTFLEGMARLADQSEIEVSRLGKAEMDASSVDFGSSPTRRRRAP